MDNTWLTFALIIINVAMLTFTIGSFIYFLEIKKERDKLVRLQSFLEVVGRDLDRRRQDDVRPINPEELLRQEFPEHFKD